MGKSTLVLLTLVLLSTSVAIAAPPPTLQGPIFVPGDGGHDEATGNQEDVAIAAGGGGFLTVWTDMRTAYADFQGHEQAGHDVYAARLDAAGNLVDAMPVILSQDAGSQQHPRVAWNGQNWLVVWENQVPSATGGSSPRKVFGARVAADGTVLDAPFEIFEAPDFAGAMTELEVAANGSDWLVVAQADSGGGLHGVRVAGSGTVLDPVPALLVAPLWFLYSDVSVHSAQGQYLLVYDGQSSFEARRFNPDLRPIGGTIYLPVEEARVGTNGTDYFVVWDPPGLTAFGSPMTIDGTLTHPAGIPIMDSSWSTSNLSQVTWDGTNWWVAHPQPYPGGGLKLTRVSVSGTVLDSPPINVFELADEEFVGPYRVTGGASGGLQVVWADQDCGCPDEWDTSLRPWDIHGKNVSATGQLGTEEPLSCAGAAQTEPDLAAGPDQFLAVFSSEKADVKRILAQRLDGQGEAIDAEPIEIASGSYVTNPSVAWNGSLYMIAWDEFYYCVGGDPPPCGTFIQAVRMLPDGTVIDAEPITAMQANHADVAALGENFLVVGRDSFIYLHHEVVPLGVRVDGATGALLDTTPLVLGWSFAVDPQVTSFRDKWLVVFERRASHDENWGGSYFNFVTADGTVQFDKFATPAACGGATPKVSASGAGALVVCREGAPWHFLNDINGMMILPDETSGPGFEISGAVEEQRAPTVTWTGTEFLVVWEDKRNGVDYFDERTDLYGARVDMFGQVLDPDGLAIATSPSAEQHPALIHSGDDILLAASLFRDADTNYRLGVYHTPGTLNDPPEVSFAESATMGCSPFEVSFTDQSVGDVSSWYWSFGDGNTSTERNPTHVYAAPGAYSVYLTASGGSGPASHVKFDLVTVDQGTETDFWTPATSGCAPLDVNFYNTTIGDQTDWLWMFGDDTVSTEQVTTHTYEYPGDYTVMLTANGACGPDTAMKVEYIQIDRMCPIQDGAVEDYFVEGEVTGTYAGTHADDNLNTWQSIYEVSVPVEGGTTWLLEHRWRFEATGGTEGMEFYVDFYVYQDPDEEFIFEYSLDNVNFVPLLSISDPWSSEHRVPLPPGLQGTFWIRMIDSDRTTADTAKDFIFIYGMAVESGVPTPYHRVPATMGLQFAGPDSLQWMPAAAATQYDVLWGNLGDLRVNGSVGDAQCGWEDYPGTTLLEPSVPPAGAGYYYLVRGDAAQLAAGTLDNVPGLSTPEDRDQEAGTAGGLTCEDMP